MKKGLREPRKKALSFQGVLKSLTWTISIDLIALFVGASVLLAAPKLFSAVCSHQENGEFLLDQPRCADAYDPDAPDETLDQTESGKQRQRRACVEAGGPAPAQRE